jgi:hypothetical protein
LHLVAGFFVALGGTAAASVNNLISDTDLLVGEEKLVYEDPCNQIIERRPERKVRALASAFPCVLALIQNLSSVLALAGAAPSPAAQ